VGHIKGITCEAYTMHRMDKYNFLSIYL